MSKIKAISVKNFKIISDLEVDFNGCTAIIIGGNNKGKSSFLRSLPDRIRYIRPEVMVKNGEKEGSGELVLDSGERFTWEFNTDGKDKLSYWTKEGIKTSATKELGERFFPPVFDIDKFLQSSPKNQALQLQKIIGIDFADIDSRYELAYADRTEKNRDAEKFHAKLSQMEKPEKVDPVDVSELVSKKDEIRTKLNKKYLDNKAENDRLTKEWQDAKDLLVTEFHNDTKRKNLLDSEKLVAQRCLTELIALGYLGNEVSKFIDNMETITEVIDKSLLVEPLVLTDPKPDDTELQEIDAKLLTASETNAKAKVYTDFIDYKAEVESAHKIADEADQLVKAIEEERQALIRTAKFPEGIEITMQGIMVDGFPLDKNQISTSKLYCAALRIASINLGEVKTLYFDASFLDKFTLGEIQEWASKNDLQLLIERPDFDGGDIEVQFTEG
jgi:AAA15 family ATPase/GTPase